MHPRAQGGMPEAAAWSRQRIHRQRGRRHHAMPSSTRDLGGPLSSTLLTQIVAQRAVLVGAVAHECEHRQEPFRRQVSLDAVDLAILRWFLADIIVVGEKLNGGSAADSIFVGELSLTEFFAVKIGDHSGAAEIERDHLEMVADVGFDVLLGEIDKMHVPAMGTARLLPYDRQLLASLHDALAIIRKLEKAVEKPVLAIVSIVGYDRHRQRPPCGQRKAGARRHQCAP